MTVPTAAEVVARRRRERAALLEVARGFAAALDAGLEVRAVVVFGSVARGDHHHGSDVDVLVVAQQAPADYLDRLRAVGWPPPHPVEPVVWTVAEWCARLAKRDPIAVESVEAGVWLEGAVADLESASGPDR